ncbi:MAG: hypothetical protein J7L62_04070 [Candidatus Aminicenantes bacterium]|nr:hypothetical protein [Candidatus Aminicenantes bacterium]
MKSFEEYQKKDQQMFDRLCEYMKKVGKKEATSLLYNLNWYHKNLTIIEKRDKAFMIVFKEHLGYELEEKYKGDDKEFFVWFIKQPFRQRLLILTQLEDYLMSMEGRK